MTTIAADTHIKKAKRSSKKAKNVRSLRLSPTTSNTFLVISTDFDGSKNKVIQIIASIILLGLFVTTIYMAVLTNQIAQQVMSYI